MQVLLRGTFTLMLIALLAACESENKPKELEDLNRDLDSPTIEKVLPETNDGEILLPTKTPLNVYFSELIDETSVLNDGMILGLLDVSQTDITGTSSSDEIPQETVSASISFSEQLTPTFDPVTGEPIDIKNSVVSVIPSSGRFALGSRYQLSLERTIKDRSDQESINPVTGNEEAGNFLDTDFSVLLNTRPGTWEAETSIQNVSANQVEFSVDHTADNYPLLLLNSGSALNTLAYVEDTREWLSPLIASNTVDTNPLAVPSASNGTGSISKPQIISIAGDQAGVIWIQQESSTLEDALFFNYFQDGNWIFSGSALVNDNSNTRVVEAQLVRTYDERLVILWVEVNLVTNEYTLQLRTYDPGLPTGTQFGDRTSLYRTSAELASIQINNDQAVSVFAFVEGSGSSRLIRAGRVDTRTLDPLTYDPATDWNLLETLQTNNSFESYKPQLSLNARGEGYLVWQQSDNSRFSIWRSRHVNGRFLTPELAERDNSDDAINPTVSICSNGVTAIFWYQKSASSLLLYTIATDTDAASGWSDPEILDTSPFDMNAYIESAYDRSCNLVALWGSRLIGHRTAHYQTLTKDWSLPQTLGNTVSGSSPAQLIRSDELGSFLAVRLNPVSGSNTPYSSHFIEDISQ